MIILIRDGLLPSSVLFKVLVDTSLFLGNRKPDLVRRILLAHIPAQGRNAEFNIASGLVVKVFRIDVVRVLRIKFRVGPLLDDLLFVKTFYVVQ